MLGAVLGGVVPILYSIFGDLYPASKRSMVTAAVATASGGGILLGQVLSGLIGAELGWRAPFVVIGLLGLPTMSPVFWKAEEPPRSAFPPDCHCSLV